MKQKLVLILLIVWASSAYAQINAYYFKLRVDNVIGVHSWVYATDPNETGHLTYSSDSSTFLFDDKEPRINYFSHLYTRGNDTLIFSEGADLTLVFDQPPHNVKSINFYSTIPNNFGCNSGNYYQFNVENVSLSETSNEFECQLKGLQILGHMFHVNKSTCTVDGSSESWKDFYRDSAIADSSIVYFSFSKNIIQSKVNINNSTSPIKISPNPTTGIITVHNAPANILHVTITNVLGETVTELTNPGTSDFTLDLSQLPLGTYFARFSAAGSVIMRKIIRE